jgi:hypothetical protein
MTEALQTLFEGKEIRIITDENGDILIPISDIASAWGIDRSTPDNMIRRNPESFYRTVATALDAASTPMECLNERGLYLMMGKITTSRVKNKSSRDAIIRFQQWFPELIQKYRKKEIVQIPAQPEPRELDEVISDDLREAKQIAELTGTDPKLMQAAALRRHKNGMYDAFAEVLEKQALSVRHGEPGWYNPSGLVELCRDPHLTADRLNKWLENYREDGEWRPFQYREGKLWRLTKRGMEHGREYQYNLGNGHSEPRISWRASVLYACGLKRDLAPDQVMLPQKSQY